VFVEVKTVLPSIYPPRSTPLHRGKQQRIIRAALSYMKWKRLEDEPMRFDLLLIEADA